MCLSHSRISVGAHFAFTSSFSATAAFPAIRCRCGKPFSAAPFLQAFWTALSLCLFATTAAFPAIRCRCGKPFSSAPFLQAFRTPLPSFPFSATAANSAIRCRCGLWVRASGQSETNVKTGQRPKKADCVQNRPVSKLDGKNCDENCMAKQVAKIGWRNRMTKQGGETEWRKRDGDQNGAVVRKTDKWSNSQNVAVVEEIGRLVDLSC